MMKSGLLCPPQQHLKLDHSSWQEPVLKFSGILCTSCEPELLLKINCMHLQFNYTKSKGNKYSKLTTSC